MAEYLGVHLRVQRHWFSLLWRCTLTNGPFDGTRLTGFTKAHAIGRAIGHIAAQAQHAKEGDD